uniref:Uncharacterized protein n=1 Tax=Tanacetum cinerariifolium TaxID=118510 RepID=A0A6L2KYQ5_TANCI|nr:hypothetical protein [Tanacetum cinerariifolium]
MHSKGDDSPITKLSNTVKGTYKFRMEIPDTMIRDAFKQSTGYKYYKAKKVESKKSKDAKEPKEQNESPVKSGRGKGYMCYRDQEENVPITFKKDDVPRKTISLTVAKETVVVELAKSISIQEQRTQQHESVNETDDADNSGMELSNDNSKGDDVTTRYENLLGETLVNELTDLMSNPVYTDAHTTSAMHNPEGNPEVRSFLSGASEKSKKLMQKAKKNIRKINFKKAAAQKFREYDQKLEALTNFNVSEAF